MRKLSTSPHESAIIEDGGVADTRPTLHEGRLHVPAMSFALIGMGGEKDEEVIGGTILMGVGVMGLSCNLTPPPDAEYRQTADRDRQPCRRQQRPHGRRRDRSRRETTVMSRILAALDPADAWAIIPLAIIIVGACFA